MGEKGNKDTYKNKLKRFKKDKFDIEDPVEEMKHTDKPKTKADAFKRFRRFESNMLYHHLKGKKKLENK